MGSVPTQLILGTFKKVDNPGGLPTFFAPCFFKNREFQNAVPLREGKQRCGAGKICADWPARAGGSRSKTANLWGCGARLMTLCAQISRSGEGGQRRALWEPFLLCPSAAPGPRRASEVKRRPQRGGALKRPRAKQKNKRHPFGCLLCGGR